MFQIGYGVSPKQPTHLRDVTIKGEQNMTIVYTSETGFTAEYAKALGTALQLPVYSLQDALEGVEKDREILYLGWLMAGKVKDYEKASKRFRIVGLCGVGIRPDCENMVTTLSKNYALPQENVFYLPGGYHPQQLKGGKKVALTMVLSILSKKIKSQKSISAEEEHLLEVFSKGGSLAKDSYLDPINQWLRDKTAS